MSDWASEKATAIVGAPGILQVWPRAGYCKKCNQPLGAAAVHLLPLREAIAQALRECSTSSASETSVT